MTQLGPPRAPSRTPGSRPAATPLGSAAHPKGPGRVPRSGAPGPRRSGRPSGFGAGAGGSGTGPGGPRPPHPAWLALREFARRYGWRAYVLPVLVVVTVVVLVNGAIGGSGGPAAQAGAPGRVASGGPSAAGQSAPPTASPSGQVKVDQSGGNVLSQVEDSSTLPPGPDYTAQGTGTYSVLPGSTPVVGSGPLRRYTIEVENGITGIDVTAMAAAIDATLDDPRSWTGNGQFSLQRVDSGSVDFRITLTSSLTVRGLCGYTQQIETSCYDPDVDRVVLNDSRWVRGAVAYANDIDTYRQYMINHETGHALGFEHVYDCLPDGKAPTMMQQTISVQATNGQMCQPNPWPNPTS